MKHLSDLQFDRSYGAEIKNLDFIFPESILNKKTVLTLGGDLGSYRFLESKEFINLLKFLSENFLAVMLIRGNNECFYDVPDRSASFFDSDYLKIYFLIKEIIKTVSDNVFLLENEVLEFDNCVIFGAPMFTNFFENLTFAKYAFQRESNYDQLKYPGSYYFTNFELAQKDIGLTPRKMYWENFLSKKLLFDKSWGEGKKKFGLVHYPINFNANGIFDEMKKNDEMYYKSNSSSFEKEIVESNLDYVLYGHSHYNYEEIIGKTKVMGNSFLVSKLNFKIPSKEFNPNFLIDLNEN